MESTKRITTKTRRWIIKISIRNNLRRG